MGRRSEGAGILTRERRVRVCCPIGCAWATVKGGGNTYKGAQDSGLLPYRVCMANKSEERGSRVNMGRRSEGAGISTNDGAQGSGLLPYRV